MNAAEEITTEDYELAAARKLCEDSHLFFTKYFFWNRQQAKFLVNWHHQIMCEEIDNVLTGKTKNLCVTVPPGSSKTELFVINLIARGLAVNPRARFLHLSGSDSLASLNSSTAREIVRSDEFQTFWPMRISEDADSKKRWNVELEGKIAGGVYATALGGQVTGFRAGHMTPGFSGALIIDDPIKPEDAFSKPKLEAANRKFLTTVKSRLANPDVPIIIIMQRIAENDPVGFIQRGNLGRDFKFVSVPAVIDKAYVDSLPPEHQKLVKRPTDGERVSYWPYKEPITALLAMERGEGTDSTGQRISRHVFNSQYQQRPVALGGNIIRGEMFKRYEVLPIIKHRVIYADTAQKTKEANDYSVFEEWGVGVDNQVYLIDMVRGKWEAPELKKRAVAFWVKCNARPTNLFGHLRKLKVEDKVSGTGLIQTLKLPPDNIPVEGIPRDRDKLTRVMDALPYIEAGLVHIPESAPFTNDFVAECEAFSPDMTHDHDDQVDPAVDAILDLLSTGNKMRQWEELGKRG